MVVLTDVLVRSAPHRRDKDCRIFRLFGNEVPTTVGPEKTVFKTTLSLLIRHLTNRFSSSLRVCISAAAAGALTYMCGSRIAGIAHHYMPIRIEKLTGAFRPLCIGQPSHRLPACVSALRVLVSSGPSLHQSSHSAASFSSREGRKPPDRPEPPQEAVAGDADIAAPKTTQPARPSTLSEPLDLSKQDSKSAARPLSASPYVLDDSQHLIKAGSLPGHAWPLLTKLHLAGTEKLGFCYVPSLLSITLPLQVMMSLWLEEQCEICCSTESQRTWIL